MKFLSCMDFRIWSFRAMSADGWLDVFLVFCEWLCLSSKQVFMKELLKTCQIFRRSELLFAFGVIRTPYGGFTVPPASILPVSVVAAELGQAVLKIFSGLPNQLTEVNLATARQPYLAYLKGQGFKSLAAFEKGSSLVAVHFDGEWYEIERFIQNEKRAFLPLSSMKLTLEASGEEVGRAVLAAFDAVHCVI